MAKMCKEDFMKMVKPGEKSEKKDTSKKRGRFGGRSGKR